MAIDKITNFIIYAPFPIDSRNVKATIIARNAIPSEYRYDGLQCYVVADSTMYMLIGGVEDSNWVPIIGSTGAVRYVVTVNNNDYEGIEIGTNIFENPSGISNVIVQFRDSSGNTLNFSPKVDGDSITISSAKTYPGAKVIIL